MAAAETAQMNTLADASKKMEEATKEETQTEKTDAKDKKALGNIDPNEHKLPRELAVSPIDD